MKLIAYGDSDYVGDVDDRKTIAEFFFLFGFGVVSWYSKKQPIVSLSTTKVEFSIVTSGFYQAIWLKRLLIILD